jgi:hypothetical protein
VVQIEKLPEILAQITVRRRKMLDRLNDTVMQIPETWVRKLRD